MLQHAAGAGRAHALRANIILDRHREAGQRAERLAGASSFVDRRGLREYTVAVDVQECAHSLVDGRDPVKMRLGDLDTGHRAAPQQALQFAGRCSRQRARHSAVLQDLRDEEVPAVGLRRIREGVGT